MTDKLTQLRKFSVVVADTGDLSAIKRYQPQDATTNPSLILQATEIEECSTLIDEALKKEAKNSEHWLDDVCDQLLVNFGEAILTLIPGRVSTEVDPHLSFDTQATIAHAQKLIERYQTVGVDPNRVLIKIAATWEGIEAVKYLEKIGIHCNVTLIFHPVQALAAADAGATLVSPFIGRIYDWHCKKYERDYCADEDPGVLSVKTIFKELKSRQYNTTIMGASFRHARQIEALAGCDYLTIAPKLMAELAQDNTPLAPKLDAEQYPTVSPNPINKAFFERTLRECEMADEKLNKGIKLFSDDLIKMKAYLKTRKKIKF